MRGRRIKALGDVPGGYTDELYTGEESGGLFQLQTYRDRVREFQSTLEAVDRGAQAAWLALEVDGLDPDVSNELVDLLADYQERQTTLRLTAQAINAGASVINSAGGRFPVLSIPAGLGLLPVALPLAAVAAVATAVTLIQWGNTWLRGLNDRLRLAQQLAAVNDPDARAKLAEAVAVSDGALRAAESSPLANLATMIKWGAIAVGAFFAFQAFSKQRG